LTGKRRQNLKKCIPALKLNILYLYSSLSNVSVVKSRSSVGGMTSLTGETKNTILVGNFLEAKDKCERVILR